MELYLPMEDITLQNKKNKQQKILWKARCGRISQSEDKNVRDHGRDG